MQDIYRKLFITNGEQGENRANMQKALYLCGVPLDATGAGYFYGDSTTQTMNEGVDFLAVFPLDATNEDMIQTIRDLGLSSHLSPEYR